MDFMVHIDVRKLARQINYQDNILLIGSCFTEHIGNSLGELKFSVLQNPNGILFDPSSVARSLKSYIRDERYTEDDFFLLNEIWHSWEHHSRFSDVKRDRAVYRVNASQVEAHEFLGKADWVIITLGSAFSYRLTDVAATAKEFAQESSSARRAIAGRRVANCHRASAQWFDKNLMTIAEIISILESCLEELFEFNSRINVILTVSPVRHIRDGVVDNNRSKARLIEAVHSMVQKFDRVNYFPAYELVIDVLRDYRFYDVDLVHPNYMATEFVLEKFAESCIDETSRALMEEVKPIVIARKHKAFQPETMAHKQFLKAFLEKSIQLKTRYPFLELSDEINYFKEAVR